jgi:hypothetical protein
LLASFRIKPFFFSIFDQAKTHLDTLLTTTPLVSQILLNWLSDSFAYFRLTDAEQAAAAAQGLSKPLGIGYGIGLGFAIFSMQGENGTFISDAFSNTNVEVSSLVSNALDHLHLSLFNKGSMKDDESLDAE